LLTNAPNIAAKPACVRLRPGPAFPTSIKSAARLALAASIEVIPALCCQRCDWSRSPANRKDHKMTTLTPDELIDRVDLKGKTIKLMTDIDAGIDEPVREWMRLCKDDRATALFLMIDGEIIKKTDRPDGSVDLDYLMPNHRALVIFRAGQ
jgi:hypothetical protein